MIWWRIMKKLSEKWKNTTMTSPEKIWSSLECTKRNLLISETKLTTTRLPLSIWNWEWSICKFLLPMPSLKEIHWTSNLQTTRMESWLWPTLRDNYKYWRQKKRSANKRELTWKRNSCKLRKKRRTCIPNLKLLSTNSDLEQTTKINY